MATDIKGNRPPTTLPGKAQASRPRTSARARWTNEEPASQGLQAHRQDGGPGNGQPNCSNLPISRNGKPAAIGWQQPSDKMAKPANLDRPVGKPKPAATDRLPSQNVSPLGEVNRDRDAMKQSNRGNKSMGGGGVIVPVAAGGGRRRRRRRQRRSSFPSTSKGGGGGGGGRGGGVEQQQKDKIMINKHLVSALLLGAALVTAPLAPPRLPAIAENVRRAIRR